MELVDTHRRKFVYLRLSVTDRCNFRCVYCLPNGYQDPGLSESELSVAEVRRLVSGFTKLGVWKIRLTGGEPTVRRDIIALAETVASVPGIRKVALSTNAGRLAQLAGELRTAGITSVNISLDSLDEDTFNKTTQSDRFAQVMNGIDVALGAGFDSVKVNAVLMRGQTELELQRFISWVRDRPVSVRFIELMRTGGNTQLFEERALTGGRVQFKLLKDGWTLRERSEGDGPAFVYTHPDFQGTIGVIAPYSPGFCETCNRLRVTSRGALRLCLFGEKDEPLRNFLAEDSMEEALIERIRDLVLTKPLSHHLLEGNYGATRNFADIGG